jgi:hypothetical protein
MVGFRVRVSVMVKVDETLLCLLCQLYDYVGSSNFTDVCGAQTSATLFHWLGNSFLLTATCCYSTSENTFDILMNMLIQLSSSNMLQWKQLVQVRYDV